MSVSAPRIQRMRSKLPARSSMAILVGLLFRLAAAHAGDVGTELYNEMRAMMGTENDALARSVGLPPLRGDDPPQIRLSVISPPMGGGGVVGYIVTAAGTRKYQSDRRYAVDGTTVPMRLTGVRTGIQYAKFVSLLREIPPYGGLILHCGGADFATVVVDFVLDGHTLLFRRDEDTACIDSGSQALMEIHRQITS